MGIIGIIYISTEDWVVWCSVPPLLPQDDHWINFLYLRCIGDELFPWISLWSLPFYFLCPFDHLQVNIGCWCIYQEVIGVEGVYSQSHTW